MMAEGGNKELGDVKENKALKLPWFDATDARSWASSCDLPTIIYRSSVTANRVVDSDSSRRSGRMLAEAAGGGGRDGKRQKQQNVLNI
jgi:hypothetical protein